MSNKTKYYRPIPPPAELTWIVVCFVQAFNVWAKCLEKSVSSAKITISQLTAIQAMYYNKRAMSPTEISRLLPLETRSVSPLIDRLHKRRLVTKRRSKTDRRSLEVELTKQSLELLGALIPDITKVMSDVFGKFSDKERDQFIKLIHKVIYASADYLGANKKHLDETALILSGMKKPA